MRIFRNSKVVDILRNLNLLKEDRVLFCTIRSYYNLKSLLVSNVYVDLIDSYSLNYDRRSKKGLIGFINKIQSALHRYTEKKLIKLTSGVFVVSRVDAKWLNDPKVHVLNLGVSIQEKRNISIVESSTIGFLGNLNYGPNQRAVYWFVKHVLPILLKSNSQIKFLIAGNFSEKLRLPNSDNIKVIGQVRSQYDFYSTVKVSIAPLVDGSGMQNKVLEAMSVGTPVVASSIAANPLGAKDEIEIMVADTPELFADCVNTLLNNEEMANEIGLNGRFYVQNNHDWDQIDKEFIRILQIENEIDPI
jgi:glycosyltransferase involved in cell wall biosynthesis